MTNSIKRLVFSGIFLGLVAALVALAIFPTGIAMQPYIGQALIPLAIFALVRVIIPNGLRMLPLYVFIASIAIELTHVLDIIAPVSHQPAAWTKTVAGISFSWANILCYAIGCELLVVYEIIRAKKEAK